MKFQILCLLMGLFVSVPRANMAFTLLSTIVGSDQSYLQLPVSLFVNDQYNNGHCYGAQLLEGNKLHCCELKSFYYFRCLILINCGGNL